MTKKEAEERWLEGRSRPVRVYLTEEEHALVRAAAARADKSVSRFSVESIVDAAEKLVGEAPSSSAGGQAADAAKKPAGKRGSK
jgi:hypothetical protein